MSEQTTRLVGSAVLLDHALGHFGALAALVDRSAPEQPDRWLASTQSGAIGPIPPTGRAFDFHHAHRFRFRDGLIIEHWAVRDDLRGMIQSGIVTPPGRPPA